MDVLINHPQFGSLWLTRAKIVDGYVEGLVWDSSDAGSPYMPDDYMGHYEYMNFPVSCIRKKEEYK